MARAWCRGQRSAGGAAARRRTMGQALNAEKRARMPYKTDPLAIAVKLLIHQRPACRFQPGLSWFGASIDERFSCGLQVHVRECGARCGAREVLCLYSMISV